MFVNYTKHLNLLQERNLYRKSKHIFQIQKRIYWKSRRLWNNVEKYCRAGQATNDNVIRRKRIACWTTKDFARAHANTHTHTPRIYNTYCFSMAIMVTRTPLNVTLYVHSLSCIIYFRVLPCLSFLREKVSMLN